MRHRYDLRDLESRLRLCENFSKILQHSCRSSFTTLCFQVNSPSPARSLVFFLLPHFNRHRHHHQNIKVCTKDCWLDSSIMERQQRKEDTTLVQRYVTIIIITSLFHHHGRNGDNYDDGDDILDHHYHQSPWDENSSGDDNRRRPIRAAWQICVLPQPRKNLPLALLTYQHHHHHHHHHISLSWLWFDDDVIPLLIAVLNLVMIDDDWINTFFANCLQLWSLWSLLPIFMKWNVHN